MKIKLTTLGFLATSLLASAGTLVDDLSDDPLNPSIINLSVGGVNGFANSVFNSNNTGGSVGDIDFFTLVVPDGFRLSAVNLNSLLGGDFAFIGFVEGSTIPLSGLDNNADSDAAGTGFGNISNGQLLVDEDSLGNILPDLLTDAALPFDPEAGEFAFVFQNTGANVNDFDLTFEITPVPEPSVFALAGLGLLGAFRRRRG